MRFFGNYPKNLKDLPVQDKDIQKIKEELYSRYALPAEESGLDDRTKACRVPERSGGFRSC